MNGFPDFLKNISFYMSRKGKIVSKVAQDFKKPALVDYARNRQFDKMKEILGEEGLLQLDYALGSTSLFSFKLLTWKDAKRTVDLFKEFDKMKKEAKSAPKGTIILKRPFVELIQNLEKIYGEKNLRKLAEYRAINIKDEPEVLIVKIEALFSALRSV